MTRIKLVVGELEKTVLPLKEQSVVAKKYVALKEELEDLDIALMVNDIASLTLSKITLLSPDLLFTISVTFPCEMILKALKSM